MASSQEKENTRKRRKTQNAKDVDRRAKANRRKGVSVPRTYKDFCIPDDQEPAVEQACERHDIGDLIPCSHCGALMWLLERTGGPVKRPLFRLCCGQGKINLPPLKMPPPFLKGLFDGTDKYAKLFKDNINYFNSRLAFGSFQADMKLVGGHGPPCVQIDGTMYHRTGGLSPEQGDAPKFQAIYLHDPKHELQNRLRGDKISVPMQELLLRLQELMHTHNPFIKAFKNGLMQMKSNPALEYRLVISAEHKVYEVGNGSYDIASSDQICGLSPIIPSAGSLSPSTRDIVLEQTGGGIKHINILHKMYDAYLYVLLFIFADHGWNINYMLKKISMMKHACHRFMLRTNDSCADSTHEKDATLANKSKRDHFSILLRAGRLGQQYVVDKALAIDDNRLSYLIQRQDELRADNYSRVEEALNANDIINAGRRVILPATHTGSARYYQQLFQDAMANVTQVAHPHLFITMTCNPKWPELQKALDMVKSSATDGAAFVVRVFDIKFHQLIDKDIIKGKMFGTVIGYMWVIEFQKRGLPHAHLLLMLSKKDRPKNADDYDRFVRAELPGEDEPELRELVLQHHVHGPCGTFNKKCGCMRDGKCRFGYPKPYALHTHDRQDGMPIYRRRRPADGGATHVRYEGTNREFTVTNQWIAEYNPTILRKYECHTNVVISAKIGGVKYLYKYIYKGEDRTSFSVVANKRADNSNGGKVSSSSANPKPVEQVAKDEIKDYMSARCMTPPAAFYKIFAFHRHHQQPPVTAMPCHLEDEQWVRFPASNAHAARAALQRKELTKFTAWLLLNETEKAHPPVGAKYNNETLASTLLYREIPRYYFWDTEHHPEMPWQRRTRTRAFNPIGRIYAVSPKDKERFYQKQLLSYVKGATNFADIRTVNGVECDTYFDACVARGILEDDQEWFRTLDENSQILSASGLRQLFSIILSHCPVARPLILWDKFQRDLSDDFRHSASKDQFGNIHDHALEIIVDNTLIDIDRRLRLFGFELKSFGLPCPTNPESRSQKLGQLIDNEKVIPVAEHKAIAEKLSPLLYADQREVLDRIGEAIGDADRNGKKNTNTFFLDAPGGYGKTLTLAALMAHWRARDRIVIAVASSGIAAQLLTLGQTAHSRFKIPINITADSVCAIKKRDDPTAELLRVASLIVWDEAPMMHAHVFEAVDRSLRDILDNPNALFGGLPILLCGDFRQILPIVKRGSRSQIMDACLLRSPLWEHFTILHLTQNMRVKKCCDADPSNSAEIKEYGEFLLKLGSGHLPRIPGRPAEVVQLPSNIMSTAKSDSEFIDEVFPNLAVNGRDKHWLRGRAILTTLNATVDRLNEQVMQKFVGKEYICYSADSVSDEDDQVTFTPDILNQTTPSGLPPHKLVIKEGAPLMFLRNLGGHTGACNGTRVIAIRVTRGSLTCEFVDGELGEKDVQLTIPRIRLTPTDSVMPYTMTRVQFPVRIAFAMTINKSQGQTLHRAGLCLFDPVFAQGQLYVGLSRVGSPHHITVRILNNELQPDIVHHADKNGAFTKNPVYFKFPRPIPLSVAGKPVASPTVPMNSNEHLNGTHAVLQVSANAEQTMECVDFAEPASLLESTEASIIELEGTTQV